MSGAIMCSSNELKNAIEKNTVLLKQHMTDTQKQFEEVDYKMESLADAVTRAIHATERTDFKIQSHKDWEEGYQKDFEDKVDKMGENNELMTDFMTKMASLAWFSSKLKGVFIWIMALGGAAAVTNEIIKRFHD